VGSSCGHGPGPAYNRTVFPALFLAFFASIVNDVRALIDRNDLAAAEAATRSYRAQLGQTPELAAAVSWLARANLAAKRYDQADKFAGEAERMGESFLGARRLDSDPWLPTAVGAAIEVHAQALAARGGRSEAVAYLNEELAKYRDTSIGERIRKNINLLSLEGKRAPALEGQSLATLRGHPVLLFFWAHWCPDCKAMAPGIASLLAKYGPKGLVAIAPTRLYGYVAGGEPAPPEVERRYIERVRGQYYAALAGMPTPVSSANFLAYGASTTPTLVLIDSTGIVRYYHPGAAAMPELAARIERLLAK
jgi:thiol-disulfide isomerase/thioredoxin